MATRTRRQQNNGNKDAEEPATALSIDSNVLRSLVTDVTTAMTTAISNKTFPVSATPMTTTYSSTIDLYYRESFKTKSKEDKY